MAPTIRTALVLGGGGVTGVAWEIGLLAGFADAGLTLTDADLIVGTSAGSVVAVHVASGAELQASYAAQTQGPGDERPARMGAGVIARLIWAALTSKSPAHFGQRMGRLAQDAKTISEAERSAVIRSRLPASSWPERTLRITAVDAQTGELRVFGPDDGVPLAAAVGASCAVPGVWPPVTIDGRRYIDGGMRSATNASVAAGFERVLVIAPIAVGVGIMPSVSAQVLELQRAGSRVTVVSPSRAAQRAMGRNSLDPAFRAAAARAGRAQAPAEVEAVRSLWLSTG